MEAGGSTGLSRTMGSQQLQGMMLHELLEAWPGNTWKEAWKVTAGSE